MASTSVTGDPQRWELVGTLDDHIQTLIECIYRSKGEDLRKVPRVKIDGSRSIDVGGVFCDKINRVFEYLLMKCFMIDEISHYNTFSSSMDVRHMDMEKYYHTFGKILY